MNAKAFLFCGLKVLCLGIGAILDKFAVKNLHPTVAFLTRYYFFFAAMIPVLVLTWEKNRSAMLQADRWTSLILFGSILVTTTGMLFYYHALSLSQASRVVSLCATYPLVAFFLSLFFLGEPLSWVRLLGTFLVIGGVSCLVR